MRAPTPMTQAMFKKYEAWFLQKFRLVLSYVNEGITKNCNKTCSMCRGKYIVWIGGDDLMEPTKIEQQVRYMEDHPECTICYHNLQIFDSDTKQYLRFFNTPDNIHEGDVKVSIKYGTFNGAAATMLRADKTPNHGFDEKIPIASDWLYWVETLINGCEIHYLDDILGKYRRHSRNITSIQNKRIAVDHLKTALLIMKRYFSKSLK